MTRPGVRAAGLLLALGVAAAPSTAPAQNVMATLRGRVFDEQGGVLEGASVVARNTDTNASRTVVTGRSGEYFIPNLPAGPYELKTALPGFSQARTDGLVLRVDQEASVNVTLIVGVITEEALVTAAAPLLETTRNTIGTIIDKDQIDRLPVIERDFTSLAGLSPGVTIGTGGIGPGLSMNGQRSFANGFYVDGATAEWQHTGKQSSAFVKDLIQEFQVMTSSYPAEFGTASGGIINAITRSGTNDLHGRLYGFFRDDALDAASFAGSFDASGKPQYLDDPPPLSQTRLGAFISGPILKDRLFFFAGFERFDHESTAALAISQYWRQRGLKTLLPVTARDHPFMLKVDADFDARNHLSMRFDRTNRIDTNQATVAGALQSEETRMRVGGPVWNVVGSWTTTIGNSRFNEVRAAYGSIEQLSVCNKSGTGGSGNLALGPPGTFSQQEYPGAVLGCPFFSGLLGETTLQIADSFAWGAGRHRFKAGAQAYRVRTILDAGNAHDGWWAFPSDTAFDLDDPASYPIRLFANTGRTAVDVARWNGYAFLQDAWQITSGLTLNLGLRYDYDTTLEAGNEYVDAKNAEIVARKGGAPLLQKARPDADNVAPRLGIVWSPRGSSRTVVRLAAGRFYDQHHNNFKAIQYLDTLLSNGNFTLNANNPLSWGPFGSPQALRLFLASSFPYFPDLSLAPASAEVIRRTDSRLKVPYSDQFTVGGSQELGRGISFEADYVLSRGWGAPAAIDENIAVYDGVYSRPDPRFGPIATVRNAGKSTYNALLTQLRYRSARGGVQATYTLSKATSNSSATILTFGGPTNPLDLAEDEGPDDADRRHNLALNGNVMLPWGLEVSGVFVYRSAPPWSVGTFEQLDADPFADRPEPRNSRRGDAFSTLDLRAAKTLQLRDRVRATVYWEVYNVLNIDNFRGYIGSLQSPLFGLPTAAEEKRRQQAGFRVEF
jgi:outer membrane receptor protein involved in Fe transport